jgi:MOSC domain-containing protein YiiM
MDRAAVAGLFLNKEKAAPMSPVDEVRAVAGRGLEGNRYFLREAEGGEKWGPDREVTLIEIEAIEALNRDEATPFEAGESRRNIVTRGVPLNHLVGREFRVGEATFRGIRLCEPCSHLEKMTRPGTLKALLHRGGLRAEILVGGAIRRDDPIEY